MPSPRLGADVRRREFLGTFGGAVAAWPLMAGAQDSTFVIGYLSSRSEQSDAPFLNGFRRGLSESGGYVEKRASFEFRWADNDPGRLAGLAAELVGRKPTVMLAGGGSGTAQIKPVNSDCVRQRSGPSQGRSCSQY